jgi:ATP-binding cassette subfamily B protein
MIGRPPMGLFAGLLGAKLGARASAGFAKNLRSGHVRQHTDLFLRQYRQIFHGRSGDRLTTDVSNLQNAFQMILRMCVRAPTSMLVAMIMAFIINAGWPACIS